MTELRIAIADDEKDIRDGLENSLTASRTDLKLDFKKFPDIVKLIRYLNDNIKTYKGDENRSIDLLLLDVDFNGSNDGVTFLPDIRKLAPTLPIIILTGQENGFDFFQPYQKYQFSFIQKGPNFDIMNNTLQIYIDKAVHEKNKYPTLRQEIAYAFRNFNLEDKDINTIATGFHIYKQYPKEMDSSAIIICWSKFYEGFIRHILEKSQVTLSNTLSDNLATLCKGTPLGADRQAKDGLYKLKDLRNKTAHPIETPITYEDAVLFRELFFGKEGYTNGLIGKLAQYM
jgi:CheY-like chemotaxis protein